MMLIFLGVKCMLYPINTTIFITFLKHHCHYMAKTKRLTGDMTGIAVKTMITSSQVQSHELNQTSKHDAQNLDHLAFPGQRIMPTLVTQEWPADNYLYHVTSKTLSEIF